MKRTVLGTLLAILAVVGVAGTVGLAGKNSTAGAQPKNTATPAASHANIERGKKLFLSGETSCTACHYPDSSYPRLSDVGARLTASEIRKAIVDPSTSIAPADRKYAIALKDGRVYGNVLLEDGLNSETLVVVNALGEKVTIKRSQIEEIRKSISDMPDNYEQLLSAGQLEALVSYLASLDADLRIVKTK